jgi:hypothetical protein
MSRSRTVSRKRRAEPAIETSTAAGWAARAAAAARSFGSVRPSSARRSAGLRPRPERPQAGEDLLLRLRPEPAEPAQLLLRRRRLRSVDRRRSPSSFQIRGRGLRAEPGQAHERRRPRPARRALRFASACDLAVSTTSTIFSSIVLPIPAAPSRGRRARASRSSRRLAHLGRRAAVGDDANRPPPRAPSGRRGGRAAHARSAFPVGLVHRR